MSRSDERSPLVRVALCSGVGTLAIGAFIAWYELLHDKPLKCSEFEPHNASRAIGYSPVYRLTANRTLAVDVARTRRRGATTTPITCCITTTGSRIRRLQPVLLSFARQRPAPSAIVVAPDSRVPWSVVRDAALRWDQLAAVGAPVRVVRMPDQLGPLDKAWGCVRYAEHAALPAHAVLIVSDDDYKRGAGWVARLASHALLRGPADRHLVSFELEPHASTSLRVRGSNGYAAYVGSFGSASDMYDFAVRVEEACRCMDDVSIVGYMRGPRGCSVHHHSLSTRAFWQTKGVLAAGLQGKHSLHISMSANQRLRMQRYCVTAMRREFPSVPDVLATDGRT